MASLRTEMADALRKVHRNRFFADELKRYNLDRYKFEIMNERHRDAVVESIGSQISKEGGNSASFAYNVSGTDKVNQIRFNHIVDHAIKTGLSYVVFDPDGKMALGVLNFDICDDHGRIDYSVFPTKYTKRGEFTGDARRNHPFFLSLPENIKQGRIKKGECIQPDVAWIRRDLQRRPGVHLLLAQCTTALLLHSLKSVKYVVQNPTHPGTTKMMYKLDRYFNAQSAEEGYDDMLVVSRVTDSRKFFLDKFKNDEWYQRNLDREWIMHNTRNLYAGCQVIYYGKIRERYDAQQYFEHLVNAFRSKCKL